MTLLRHVEACNRFDPGAFVPFAISGDPIGRVRPETAAFLTHHRLAKPFGLGICVPGGGFKSVSAALDRIVGALVDGGLMVRRKNEMTPVLRKWGMGAIAEIDRAGLPALGLPAYGVHVNGFVHKACGLCLWVGHRARDRDVAPGKLDHLVAGGIPMGYTVGETLAKEAHEEASLPPEIAARAVPVGAITYRLSLPEGLRNDTLFVYDLELPPGLVPVGNDGEVERFELMPVARVAEILRETDDFKFNVSLVMIDFLVRHGHLDPDHEPDYAALIKGLRR